MSLWLCTSDSIRLCVCVAKCGGVWWRLMVSREAVRGVWLCRGVCVRVWGGWRSVACAGRSEVAVGSASQEKTGWGLSEIRER